MAKRVVTREHTHRVVDVSDIAALEKAAVNGGAYDTRWTWKGCALEWAVGWRTVEDDETGERTSELNFLGTYSGSGYVPEHKNYTAKRHPTGDMWLVTTPLGYSVAQTPEAALDAMNAAYDAQPEARTVTVTISNVKLEHGVTPEKLAAELANDIGGSSITANGRTFGPRNVTITDAPVKAAKK